MTSDLLTHTGAASRLIAAMPTRTAAEWRAQDLAVADAVEQYALACEGNGDACEVLLNAVQEIRERVAQDEARTDPSDYTDDLVRIASLRKSLGYYDAPTGSLITQAIDLGLRAMLKELEQESSWSGAMERRQAA